MNYPRLHGEKSATNLLNYVMTWFVFFSVITWRLCDCLVRLSEATAPFSEDDKLLHMEKNRGLQKQG
jgi:hypothetical protein